MPNFDNPEINRTHACPRVEYDRRARDQYSTAIDREVVTELLSEHGVPLEDINKNG